MVVVASRCGTAALHEDDGIMMQRNYLLFNTNHCLLVPVYGVLWPVKKIKALK